MRTLGDMIQRVRRKYGDVADDMIEDPHIETAMQIAAGMVWADVMEDTRSRKMLRAVSEPAALSADTEAYAIPDDCLRIDEVQARRDENADYHTLRRRDYKDYVFFRSGGEVFFAEDNFHASLPVAWSQGETPGTIRVWPAPSSAAGQQIRFLYFHRPVIPADYDGTLNDPNADGVNEEHLPDLVTEAIEWLTVYDLMTDSGGPSELEGLYRQYARVYRAVTAVGNPAQPKRRYVNRVQG